MKIGINFLLWTTHVEEKHFHLFSILKKAGFDGVEIPLTMGNTKHYQKIKQVLDSEGLACTTTSNGSPDKNLISPNSTIRQAGLDHLKWAIDCNEALGSNILGGPIHSSPGVFTGMPASVKEQDWCIENLQIASSYAEQAQVTLCLEFLNRFECYLMNTVSQAKQIVDAVKSPFIGIHYDTHHAHIEESNLTTAIRAAGDSIKHVHFSESHRGMLGQGLVDWQTNVQGLKSINYDGWITIEAFTNKVPGLASALHITRPLIENELECALSGAQFIHALFK
ncbi:sugar phosphate isomerase/epimerase [Paraglaciecola aquimarina]|uniref:Sugar phosphate isomerase/epimerase n=1 Tax=Paraglaciecola algarum TaxID=3050085 RepID=A0ABS9D248_9ALTE|nr:sugar phosphate isomerase/epimerase family protein [Paraglaciecola sp. G1-23]MCF2946530.1 sugar phosphate isomerase/epimerase [Paraglaciecola sp. G1-23]